MRRSGGISKNIIMKNVKSKVYVSFLIGLYFWPFNKSHEKIESIFAISAIIPSI